MCPPPPISPPSCLSICPCLSVCLWTPCKPSVLVNFHPLSPPASSYSPTRDRPTTSQPYPRWKKITIFLCPRKKRFLSSFILKSVEFWNKALYLTLRNSSKKKGNEIKPKDLSFFSLASTLFLCGVLSENGNKCCDQLTFGGSVK